MKLLALAALLAVVSLHWPLSRIAVALERHNAIDRERLDADLVTSYEAANIVMDLYGKIATLYGFEDLLGKAEAYMAQRGVLRGWKPIKQAAEKKVNKK
jgi:hypothetical protein